jgi:hypothetical protein
MGRETKGVDADLEIGEGQPFLSDGTFMGRWDMQGFHSLRCKPATWNRGSGIHSPSAHRWNATHTRPTPHTGPARGMHTHLQVGRSEVAHLNPGASIAWREYSQLQCRRRWMSRGTRVIIHIARRLKKLKASRFPRVASEKRGTASVQRLQRLQGGLPGFAA